MENCPCGGLGVLIFGSFTKPSFVHSLLVWIGQKFAGLGGRQPIEDWLNRSAVREGNDVKGHTALYDTILEALKSLEPTQPGDAIYVITDGGENASAEKLTQLEHSLESSGVRLFAFLLDGPWLTSPGQSSVTDLYALVRESGGSLASVSPRSVGPGWSSVNALYSYGKNTGASIRASTGVLQAEISGFYVLGVQFPESSAKLEDWRVDVVDAQGRRKKDVIVAFPHKLAPAGCAAQSAHR